MNVIMPVLIPADSRRNIYFIENISNGIILSRLPNEPLLSGFRPLHLYLISDVLIKQHDYYVDVKALEVKRAKNDWEQVFCILDYGKVISSTCPSILVPTLTKSVVLELTPNILQYYGSEETKELATELHLSKLREIVSL